MVTNESILKAGRFAQFTRKLLKNMNCFSDNIKLNEKLVFFYFEVMFN